MEALATENQQTHVTTTFKRFSRTKYPSHELGGEHEGAIKVKCKGSEFAGYQNFYCSECNTQLKLEALTLDNVHVNIPARKLKYSVLKIGVQCPNCRKTDMIKIPFKVQTVIRPEKSTRSD